MVDQINSPKSMGGIGLLTESRWIADLRPSLLRGLEELNLVLSSSQIEQVLGYIALLHKWGAVYNLTAIKEPADILVQHVLDCLSIINPMLVRVAPGACVLDVGSGAGLPAVMIAIACPSLSVVALDAVAKKVAFVQQVALQLGLCNLQAKHERVEKINAAHFDLTVSRAFASLSDFMTGTRGAVKKGGLWLAMKGRVPEEEIRQLPEGFVILEIVSLKVPDLLAERCLVWIGPEPSL